MRSNENDQTEVQQVNPWISVWLHPRKTIQFVMEYKTSKFVLFIAVLSGVILSLDMAVNNDLIEGWNIVSILFLMIVGPIIGVLGFYLISGIYYLFSAMLGGKGTSEQTRMAFAVSEMILIVTGLLFIVDLLVVGQDNFSNGNELSVGQSTWLVISSTINMIAGVWSTVVFIAAISEVHHFSLWKAAFVVFLPIIIIILISFLVIGFPF